jgi:hypothetical protein
LDYAYYTNRFGIQLPNIRGVTGNNKIMQLALIFINSEEEERCIPGAKKVGL